MIPTCPQDCTGNLPMVKFSKCAPIILLSEITKLYVGKNSIQPFMDWTTASEWTTRLSETATDANAIRPITVIGDKPAAAPIKKEISNGRTWTIGKDHTLNVKVDDVSDENYNFMRNSECGGQYRVWFETSGGMLYGGNEGIAVTLDLNDVLASGKDAIEELVGTATWRAQFHPERVKSPIAA